MGSMDQFTGAVKPHRQAMGRGSRQVQGSRFRVHGSRFRRFRRFRRFQEVQKVPKVRS
jgi:hypothetical protein